MAQTSPLRAIFLDFDDTLAHTSAADRLAYAQCHVQLHAALSAVASSLGSLPTRCDAILSTFKETFKAAPWDPSAANGDGPGMPVIEWRAQLWQQALDQHCPPGSVPPESISGAKLQTIFDETRLAALDYFPGALDVVDGLREAGYPLVIITSEWIVDSRLWAESHRRLVCILMICVGRERERETSEER